MLELGENFKSNEPDVFLVYFILEWIFLKQGQIKKTFETENWKHMLLEELISLIFLSLVDMGWLLQ